VIYFLYALLALVVFLVVLNGFLRGAKKVQIDAMLGLVLIALLIATFMVYGWKAGLFAIVITFVFSIVTRPLAARMASRLFAMDSDTHGCFIGLPPKTLERISKQLGRQLGPDEMMRDILSGSNQRHVAEGALLNYCEASASVREVMNQFSLSREELRQIYSELLALGAGQWVCGHWVAASALAYPETLRYLVKNKRNGCSGMETAYTLIKHFELGAPLED